MAIEQIEIGALGWTHPGWDEGYYPDGLPEDWRLDFYSHHFQVVLMQVDEWRQANRDEMTQWLNDVKDSFEFMLALDVSTCDQTTLQQIGLVKDVLGEQLQGVVLHGPVEALATTRLQALTKLCTVYVDAEPLPDNMAGLQPCWRAGRKLTGAKLGFMAADVAANTRAMRTHIEAFKQQAAAGQLYLIYEGRPPSTKAMQDAQIIVQMLV